MKEFLEFLKNNEDYITKPLNNYQHVSKLKFYLGILKVVYRGSRLAKKGLYTHEQWAKSSYDSFRHIEKCRGRFYIRGLENLHQIKKDSPVVFVANHMSSLETFVLPILLLGFTPITYVIKRELTNYVWFGNIMKAVNPICVDRINAKKDLLTILTEGIAALAKGTSVIIFPQTTRSEDFDPKEFNSLGLKLAQKAKVPIMPIALKTNFWGNGKFIKDLGPINSTELIMFKFGQLYDPNKKNTHQEIKDFIATTLAIWG